MSNGSRQTRWQRLEWINTHWGDVEFVMRDSHHMKYRATVIVSWPNGEDWDESSREPWPKGIFFGSGERPEGATDRIWIDSKGSRVEFHGETMNVAFDLAHRTIKKHWRKHK